MEIEGIQGMTEGEIKFEVMRGGRFVYYMYCFSALIVTFRQPSKIYFLRAGESRIIKGLPFTLLTLVAGWWGIPWGPIYSVQCIAKNLCGGEDVTVQVAPSAYVAKFSAELAQKKNAGEPANTFDRR
jgi:hypothetical protein